MKEIWKEVEGSIGKYKVSNHGRVWSNVSNREIGLKPAKDGYYSVSVIYKYKRQTIGKHRLVALHFIPNPHKLPEVNHVVADKGNNRADNLEWCTHKGNMKHCSENRLNPRATMCCTLDGNRNIVKTYGSIHICARDLGLEHFNIIASCEGWGDTIRGHRIRYFDESVNYYIRTKFDNSDYKYKCTRKQKIRCLETGDIFMSQMEASRAFGINQSAISNYLKGIRTKPVRGKTFEFIGHPNDAGEPRTL